MKARLCLAILTATMCCGPAAFAQAGSTNGSGSGFLNTDIMLGTGGTPGPAEANPFLYTGNGWGSGAGLFPSSNIVTGRLVQSAVVEPAGPMMMQPMIPAVLPMDSACGPCSNNGLFGFGRTIY